MSHPAPGTSTADYPIAYLTDVEGQWEKLASFCAGNPHVRLDAEGRLRVRPGATFVFGGDAIDRGPHGRRGWRHCWRPGAGSPRVSWSSLG